jgi:hypothetical protein
MVRIFKGLEPLGIGDFHAAELPPLLVERRPADPVPAAKLFGFPPRIMLFLKNSNNLFLAEPALSSWAISSLITHRSVSVQMWQSLACES